MSLDAAERLPFRDVWWNMVPSADPWLEIRDRLGEPLVVRMPQNLPARAWRYLTRRLVPSEGVGDLFRRAGIDVLFPIRPIEGAGIPFVFFVPDFQYRRLPGVNDERAVQWFDDYYRQQAAHAALVYVTSRSVFEDLREFMPELAPKTRIVFPCTVPTTSWWRRDPASVAAALALPSRYFLISNQVSAHKNHRIIARALRILRDRGIDAFVVCTGKTSDYRDETFFPALDREIRALGVSDRVRFLGVLPRDEQVAVMRRSIAFLQPSEFEGWGAAVAEAKALGKPLIASDLPVHREHEHPHVRWVATHDDAGWADALAEAWRDLPGGPDLAAEENARARTAATAVQVGRAFTAMLREAAATMRR